MEHRIEDVAASSGQADKGAVMFLALGSFPVVVGAAGRVVQCAALYRLVSNLHFQSFVQLHLVQRAARIESSLDIGV